MNNLQIYNGFGITPTSSYTAAGLDFYIPNINNEVKAENAIKAFEKSYNKTQEEINEDWANLMDISNMSEDELQKYDIVNILHLYYAYDSDYMRIKGISNYAKLSYFIENVLTYNSDKQAWGISVNRNDSICINSGIKVALEPNTAGIFFNKSGRGNEGWDVRAQVVDEDYAGYVHLSLAYTKETRSQKRVIYCGDKITQMVILPIIHNTPVEIDENVYNEIMKNSTRGSNWNGSSNDTKKTII